MSSHNKKQHKMVNAKMGRSDYLIFQSNKIREGLDRRNLQVLDFGKFTIFSRAAIFDSKSLSSQIAILGHIFSARSPGYSAQDIADKLAKTENMQAFFNELRSCTGRFLILYQLHEKIGIIGDAMGQFEVFYHEDCICFAPNISLISKFSDVKDWEGAPFYLYEKIKSSSKIQIGITTQYKNVKHLMPNHYLDLITKKQCRYYPNENDLIPISIPDAVDRISVLLEQFGENVSKRHKIAMALTAGSDSRLLLSAFRNLELRTYVFQHPNMPDDFYDIEIGKSIAKRVSRKYVIIRYPKEIGAYGDKMIKNFSEHPREGVIPYLINCYSKKLHGYMVMFGHGGEIGRSFYSDIKKVNPAKLATLIGHNGNPFVISEMKKWLDGLPPKVRNWQSIMDLFYWEQRMGNWGSRILTETSNVADVISPMNSHGILATFLSTPKKYRKWFQNKLLKTLIRRMDPRLLGLPINPTPKNRVIKVMIWFGVYDFYKSFRLRLITKA